VNGIGSWYYLNVLGCFFSEQLHNGLHTPYKSSDCIIKFLRFNPFSRKGVKQLRRYQ